VATAVAARTGVVELGAHQVAFELWSFLALVLDAIAIAGQAIVGRLLGAGDADGARAASRRMVEWGRRRRAGLRARRARTLGSAPPLFSDDEQVVRVAASLLVWVAVLQPVNAVVFVLDGVLIGAGDLRFLAWAMSLAALAFVPVAVGVRLLDLGIGWLWGPSGPARWVTRLVTLGSAGTGGRGPSSAAHRALTRRRTGRAGATSAMKRS
jgi:Na+-driven multidrug efflux pump